ncbi:MAG: L-threonylcarbamoyladenylate synthase [Gammaproteobacteria bacterium]|nr:L-threonylcarbamoyladenylate synthase [Gammaproteobacteria bacterium]MDH5650243.1 L-threonylcarbamoyladenylate synthase [Gammaproteobacteria bacterium]
MSDRIAQATSILQQGGVIAYPTEAVYGLGCDPNRLDAVQRILDLKQRPAEKGLILVAADFSQLEAWLLPLEPAIRQRVLAAWPGPVTWLCPVRPEVSPLVRGTHATLAVRVSAHPLVQSLCKAFGGPLISTSANISDQPAARSAAEVQTIFGEQLDLIVEGELGESARPTEIRDALTNTIIRSA